MTNPAIGFMINAISIDMGRIKPHNQTLLDSATQWYSGALPCILATWARWAGVDARLFYDKITDYFRGVDIPFVALPSFQPINDPNDIEGAVNSGSAEVNGFETQIKWQLDKRTNL